jgi:hypothetical protein
MRRASKQALLPCAGVVGVLCVRGRLPLTASAGGGPAAPGFLLGQQDALLFLSTHLQGLGTISTQAQGLDSMLASVQQAAQ